jgi:hypothetical protein
MCKKMMDPEEEALARIAALDNLTAFSAKWFGKHAEQQRLPKTEKVLEFANGSRMIVVEGVETDIRGFTTIIAQILPIIPTGN